MKQTKKNKNNRVSTSLLCVAGLMIILMTILIIIVIYGIKDISYAEPEVELSYQYLIDLCDNRELKSCSQIINNEVKKVYYYNLNNQGKDLTFEELVSEGGTCVHWSELYYNIGKKVGYNIKNVDIESWRNKSLIVKHRFIIWSDKTGYAKLDGTNLNFVGFSN